MSAEFYDGKWSKVISLLPKGGDYNFPERQSSFDKIKEMIPDGSKVFDYACGLGMIDIQLANEKGCKISGCDYSKVAIDFINSKVKGDFKTCDYIFGNKYDFILAIAYIEHITNPREWIDEALKKCKTLICTIPNNFRKVGEHVNMQWENLSELEDILKGLNFEIIKKYGGCHQAWESPIIMIKGDNMHPSYIDSSTGENKPVEKKVVEKNIKKKVVKKDKEKVVETTEIKSEYTTK